jgi:hypothetical protein
MTTAQTDDNQPYTGSDRGALEEILERLGILQGRLDHVDEGLHELDRKMTEVTAFFTAHRAALERAAGLLDTGAKMRGFLAGKKITEAGDPHDR